LHVSLEREVAARDGTNARWLPVEQGIWAASDTAGTRRRFAWTDRIKTRGLSVVDRDVFVEGAVSTTLEELQLALDDVAVHINDDAESRRLRLEVTIKPIGHEPRTVYLTSVERQLYTNGSPLSTRSP
jgi:hypothetical protein